LTRIDEDCAGPLEIVGQTSISAVVTGNVTVPDGAALRLGGQVNGDIVVRPGGSLVLIGTVKGAVRNEGGAVDIFGFVGRVSDTGNTESFVSRGAIIGGRRASVPSKLSAFLRG
jgi:cytoskeletal protein CcmA (bactofilin family)